MSLRILQGGGLPVGHLPDRNVICTQPKCNGGLFLKRDTSFDPVLERQFSRPKGEPRLEA